MIRLDVSLPNQTYPILFGQYIQPEACALLLENCPGKKAAIISDDNVWRLHGEMLLTHMKNLGIESNVILIPHGEASKSLSSLERIYGELFNFGQKRTDPIIAFGGGVVGDLAGFAAATYMRGVPFIQIPTTLLAQVDSSVGGKVAVNLEAGKNLVGNFYQPKLVLIDTGILATLPQREWNAGMAEVIKYTALGAVELLTLLEDTSIPIAAVTESKQAADILEKMVYFCCQCKMKFVEQDELDTGIRMMLNFGHTFGHAIERFYDFQRYNHGEAVAMGMALAARAGTVLGVSEAGTEEKLMKVIELHGLQHQFQGDIDPLITLMSGDKKNTDADVSLILLKKMGEPFLYKITTKALRQLAAMI